MEYQFLRSADFQDDVAQLVKLEDAANNNDHYELTAEAKEHIKIKKNRDKNHKRVQQVLGETIDIMTDASDNHVVGLFKPSNEQILEREEIFDDYHKALQVGGHERNHKRNGMADLDFANNLERYQLLAVQAELGISELDPREVIEGFTEWDTAREFGPNPDCAYNEKEVPLVQKLEGLAQENKIGSLRDTFDAGKKVKFYELLGELGDKLTYKIAA